MLFLSCIWGTNWVILFIHSLIYYHWIANLFHTKWNKGLGTWVLFPLLSLSGCVTQVGILTAPYFSFCICKFGLVILARSDRTCQFWESSEINGLWQCFDKYETHLCEITPSLFRLAWCRSVVLNLNMSSAPGRSYKNTDYWSLPLESLGSATQDSAF